MSWIDKSMKLYNQNKHLRQFGFIIAGGLTLIFGIVSPLLRQHSAPNWLWIVNSIIILIFAKNSKNIISFFESFPLQKDEYQY